MCDSGARYKAEHIFEWHTQWHRGAWTTWEKCIDRQFPYAKTHIDTSRIDAKHVWGAGICFIHKRCVSTWQRMGEFICRFSVFAMVLWMVFRRFASVRLLLFFFSSFFFCWRAFLTFSVIRSLRDRKKAKVIFIYFFFIFLGRCCAVCPVVAWKIDSIHRAAEDCARRGKYIERTCKWGAKTQNTDGFAVAIASIQSDLQCFLWSLSVVILAFVLAVSVSIAVIRQMEETLNHVPSVATWVRKIKKIDLAAFGKRERSNVTKPCSIPCVPNLERQRAHRFCCQFFIRISSLSPTMRR